MLFFLFWLLKWQFTYVYLLPTLLTNRAYEFASLIGTPIVLWAYWDSCFWRSACTWEILVVPCASVCAWHEDKHEADKSIVGMTNRHLITKSIAPNSFVLLNSCPYAHSCSSAHFHANKFAWMDPLSTEFAKSATRSVVLLQCNRSQFYI